jgi:hypothetical protein
MGACIQEEHRGLTSALAESRTDLASLRKRSQLLEVERGAFQERADMHEKMAGLVQKHVDMAEAQKLEAIVEVQHLKAENERLQGMYGKAIDCNASLGIQQQVRHSWTSLHISTCHHHLLLPHFVAPRHIVPSNSIIFLLF